MEAVRLNTGQKLPLLGLGTWKSAPSEVGHAVEVAIDCGYRHFDCAHLYRNEKEVGSAINTKIQEGVIKRKDVFVTSKLWNIHHRPQDVEHALGLTLEDLNLEYVDLYLIHFPMGFKNCGPGKFLDENGDRLVDDIDYLDTWKAMEKVLETGKAKAIGVSNFNAFQLQRICKEGSIKPAVNQVEYHPYLDQTKLIELCKELGILLTGYSPFGSPDRAWVSPDEDKLLEDPVIADIVKRHGKTTAQVLLRFHVQRGFPVIPKSVTPSRIKANAQIFDFTVAENDIQKMLSLNRNWRALGLPFERNHKYYPFQDNYME